MPLRKGLLLGAVGVPPAPPTAAMLAHPDRVLRFANFQRVLWALRLGVIAGLLLLLYATHILVL